MPWQPPDTPPRPSAFRGASFRVSSTVRRCLLLLFAAVAPPSAAAVEPYRVHGIMLLQPDFVLQQRAPSAEAVSGYIKAVQEAAEGALAAEPPSPASGHLVLAVRPDGRSMAWLDFRPALPAPTAARLLSAIRGVPPFEARNGVVVFALNATLWEAAPTRGFPDPAEWRKAMEGHDEPREIGDLVDEIWPPDAPPP